MPDSTASLADQLRRWTLILGVAQVLFGCLVGFIPPTAVPWFRGVVMAHIEFTSNGVLMIAIGLLARELKLSSTLLKVWFGALVIGTWFNGAAGVVGAFSGASSSLLPTANQSFPPPGGAGSVLVTGLLLACGVTIVISLALTLVGLLRSRVAAPDPAAQVARL